MKWRALVFAHLVLSAPAALATQPVVPYTCEIGPISAAPLADLHQTGHLEHVILHPAGKKKVIFIRVNYPDDATDPQTAASATAMMNQVDSIIQEFTHGKVSLDTTVTELITLPKLKDWYKSEITVRKNAQAHAEQQGYDLGEYDYEVIRFQDGPGSFAVWANIGNRSMMLKVSDAKVAAHGILHNLGLWHADFWKPTGASPIGAGVNEKLGDLFDPMGSLPPNALASPNAYEKSRIGVLPEANIAEVEVTGVYRVYALDHGDEFDGGKFYALKILKTDPRYYYVDYRPRSPALANGVSVHWSAYVGQNGSQLLDMTPGSAGGKNDAALAIGKTFTDSAAGISITPLTKNATVPESIDVRVTVGNGNPNPNPTLTANAGPNQTVVDSNRDGSEAVALNGSSSTPGGSIATYVWRTNATQIATGPNPIVNLGLGVHTITLTVADSAGNTDSDDVVITVKSNK
jgi:hypothetical protein